MFTVAMILFSFFQLMLAQLFYLNSNLKWSMLQLFLYNLTGMGSTCITESIQTKHIFPLIQLLYIVQL